MRERTWPLGFRTRSVFVQIKLQVERKIENFNYTGGQEMSTLRKNVTLYMRLSADIPAVPIDH